MSRTALSVQAPAGCAVEQDICNLLRPVHDVGGRVCGQLLFRAAAPCDGHSLQTGVGGGLHVHARVPDVQNGRAFVWEIPSGTVYSGAMYPRLAEDVPHYHRLRFAGYALSLSEYGTEGYFRKEMSHELDGRGVVFVRGDGDLDVPAADAGEKFRDAVEGPGHVGAVLAVVRQEQAPDAQNFLLTAAGFRKGPLKELVDAVADVGGYLCFAVDGIAAGREGLVGCRRYVGDGVEQGPVQVENSCENMN